MSEPSSPRPLSPDELGFETIVYDKAPPRATITLNRPDVLNAFDFRMLREITRACEDVSWDDEIRVLVVTGAGRAFCVGADLRSWGEDLLGNSNEYWKWFGAFKRMHEMFLELGKPTIARINGICVGGGNELQMACDLSAIVDDAYIRHVGLEHGSVPAGGATQWLALMVGERRAREIILLCEEIPAAKAAEWGLVNAAVPAAELDAHVDRWVESLLRKLPETTRYAKAQLNVWRDFAWHTTTTHARDWLAMSMLGDEAQGAVRAFLEQGQVNVVEVERDGAIAVVLLNRPEALNALSGEVMDALVSSLEALDAEAAIRCIVLGGSERVFAAGADVAELAAATPIELYENRRIDRWDAIRALRTPLVAAVSGYCLGGGCELAMLCDIIVASETAQFGQPEINLGVLPGAGGTQRLTHAVGKAVAMDVILTGRFLSANEALRAGLVARVVAREAWLEEAKRVARAIAVKSPVSVRLAKESVDRAFDVPLTAGLELERRSFYLARASDDATEGLTAFVEKRKPDFKGR